MIDAQHLARVCVWRGWWEAGYGPGARAECPCGWKGPTRPLTGTKELGLAAITFAAEDVIAHRQEFGGPEEEWDAARILELYEAVWPAPKPKVPREPGWFRRRFRS